MHQISLSLTYFSPSLTLCVAPLRCLINRGLEVVFIFNSPYTVDFGVNKLKQLYCTVVPLLFSSDRSNQQQNGNCDSSLLPSYRFSVKPKKTFVTLCVLSCFFKVLRPPLSLSGTDPWLETVCLHVCLVPALLLVQPPHNFARTGLRIVLLISVDVL